MLFARPLLLLYLLSIPLRSQNDPHLQPVDIFDLEFMSEPQISSDGSRILYVRNFKDIMTDKNLSNIWMIDHNGSNSQPLTSGNHRDTSPRWSPDGTRVLYLSDKDGSSQLYLRWLDSGAEAKITNLNQSPSNISWSPDGKWIAFTMFVMAKSEHLAELSGKPEGAKWNDAPTFIDKLTYRADGQGYLKNGYNQLFIISHEGGTPRQLTYAANHIQSAEWAVDGSGLFFHANLHPDSEYNPRDSEIHRINLDDLEVTTLTDRRGVDSYPKISPDGGSIVYTGYDDRYQGYQNDKIYLMNVDGSESREIPTGLDRRISNITWAADGKGVYFLYEDKGSQKLAYSTLSGKISDVAENVGGLSTGRPYTFGAYSVANNGNYAYTMGTPEYPSDLAAGGSRTRPKRLTNLNHDLFSFRKLGVVEEIWFKSSHDDRDIQGWICYPPDFDPTKKYPMILEIHGGPFLAYGPWFSFEVQLFAAAGYVVLYANPRGSASYGEEFGNAIHHNYPGEDYHDLMSGVDAVLEKGFVDPDQLYVTGGSGGGVLTAWIVGNTDRFRAAVVAKPVINWYSFVLYSDGASYHQYWFPGLPWKNQEHYMKRSPISLVGNVTTPTLLLTGESDFRTPIAETEQYYRALKLQKVETGMVRIPGASHGIAVRPSNLMAKVANILAWFGKYSK